MNKPNPHASRNSLPPLVLITRRTRLASKSNKIHPAYPPLHREELITGSLFAVSNNEPHHPEAPPTPCHSIFFQFYYQTLQSEIRQSRETPSRTMAKHITLPCHTYSLLDVVIIICSRVPITSKQPKY